MLKPWLLALLQLSLGFTAYARLHEVSVSLTNQGMALRCVNLQPGHCCRLPTFPNDLFSRVTFRNLEFWDIAAVWSAAFPPDEQGEQNPGIAGELIRVGCSGHVEESRQGPGDWTWTATGDGIEHETMLHRQEATGASYIRLPQRLPPDEAFQADLHIQGIRALAWGGGYWRADTTVGLDDLPKIPQKARRDVRSFDKGNVLARSPIRMIYPTIVTINGTEYTADGAGSVIYTNSIAGKTLNLTTLFT